MTIQLRDYQQQAIEAIVEAIQRGEMRQLVCMPTGAGKTVVMAGLVNALRSGQVLFLAHREELLYQAKRTFEGMCGMRAGIYQAETRELEAQVVCGSMATCCRPGALHSLSEVAWDLIIVDEAHHAICPSYRAIIDTLATGVPVVGVTATPTAKGLGDVFPAVSVKVPLEQLVEEGYLAEPRGFVATLPGGDVRVSDGEYNLAELKIIVDTPERSAYVVKVWREKAPDMKTLVFCVDVEHSMHMAEAFCNSGVRALAVYGEMSSEARAEALRAFAEGEVRVLTSCMILTEGYDEPTIECVVMNRPTRSKGLYIQCLGRGLRKAPGKTECLILDMVYDGHALSQAYTLSKALGKSKREEEKEAEENRDRAARRMTPKAFVEADIDLVKRPAFPWFFEYDKEPKILFCRHDSIGTMKTGYYYVIPFGDVGCYNAYHICKGAAMSEPVVKLVCEGLSLGSCVLAISKLGPFDLNNAGNAKKRMLQKPSQQQIHAAVKWHVATDLLDSAYDVERKIAQKSFGSMLAQHSDPATDAQIRMLYSLQESLGVQARDWHISSMSKARASAIISRYVTKTRIR